MSLGAFHVANVAEFVRKRLSEWGLSRVYGYPSDGVGGLHVALEKAKDFMDYVQVRHEEMAAFMASAHAKFTGRPGLCYATSGPGAIHLLTGLYDAKADHVPVVAIAGQQARCMTGLDGNGLVLTGCVKVGLDRILPMFGRDIGRHGVGDAVPRWAQRSPIPISALTAEMNPPARACLKPGAPKRSVESNECRRQI